ncbi:MAG: hypothetical protein K8R13_08525, partial [Methanococcoides sp.]|nr:hypothetical protein [Methanococcoides sp.]
YQDGRIKELTPSVKIPKEPQSTQPKESKTDNGRSFDDTLWSCKDKKISASDYKKLPSQIVKVVAKPQGSIAENIKKLLTGKKVGDYIAVPTHTVSTITGYGFAEVLSKNQIELLTMVFKNGNVYLVSKDVSFKITTVPKGKPTYQQPVQYRIKVKNSQNKR